MDYKNIVLKIGSNFIFDNKLNKIVKNISEIKKFEGILITSKK